jgi:excisionase family DNA binding protein
VDLPSPPPLLTVREVARRLRVRPVTVYRLCERGELAHIRVSNAIRIRLEDLDQYVARRRGPMPGELIISRFGALWRSTNPFSSL